MMIILGIAAWVFAAWLLLAIAVTYCVDQEQGFFAFLGLIAAGAIAHFSGTFNMLNVIHDWKQMLVFVGVYIVVGVGWAILKWVAYTNQWAIQQHEYVDKCKEQFIQRLNDAGTGINIPAGSAIPTQHMDAFTKWSRQRGYARDWSIKIPQAPRGYSTTPTIPPAGDYDNLADAPSYPVADGSAIDVVKNLNRLGLWCLYWPFSMTWTLIDDPLKKIFQYIILHVIGGLLQSFSKKAKARVDEKIANMSKS